MGFDALFCKCVMYGYENGDLEDSGGFLRKVWIGVEGSIGPVLLKEQDPCSNR